MLDCEIREMTIVKNLQRRMDRNTEKISAIGSTATSQGKQSALFVDNMETQKLTHNFKHLEFMKPANTIDHLIKFS
jgi:hypothetical protein